MKVYILMQMDENIIERISTDFRKMNDRAEDLNGGKDVFGPYGVEIVELEDDFRDILKEEIKLLHLKWVSKKIDFPTMLQNVLDLIGVDIFDAKSMLKTVLIKNKDVDEESAEAGKIKKNFEGRWGHEQDRI